MKKIVIGVSALLCFAFCHAQGAHRPKVKATNEGHANEKISPATTELPKGTVIRNGQIMLKKGYSAVYGDDHKVIIIQKPHAGGTTGAFSCDCELGSGGCSVGVSGGIIKCNPQNGCTDCRVSVVIDAKGVAITKSGINWKKLIVPSAGRQSQRTEDPDQGGEVNKNRKSKERVKH